MNTTNNQQEHKVTKPRIKVRQACDNCRKRKLKCTGKQPCSTCEAYSCDCIYSEKTTKRKKRTTKKKPSVTNPNSFINALSNAPLKLEIPQSNTFEDGTPNTYVPKSSTGSFSEITSLGTVDMLMPPIIKGDNALYEDDEDFQNELNSLETTFLQLKSLSSTPDDTILNILNELENKIKKLVDERKPQIDQNKVALYQNSSTKSLETNLLKNKYSDTIHLTRFAIFSGSKSEDQYTNPGQPLIDEMFGLYSPFQIFSFQGIGYSYQEHLKGCKVGSISKDVKETLYLVLRFFDMCFLRISENSFSITNPLENYLKMKNIPVSASNTPSSTASTGIVENSSIASILINKLPQPFVLSNTGVSTDHLLSLLNDNYSMFRTLLDMYDKHKKTFDEYMIEMTSGEKLNCSYSFSNNETNTLLNFLDGEQLLLSLCYSYYNSTVHGFVSSDFQMSYLEELVRFISIEYWQQNYFAMDKVLSVALDKAMCAGLSRWEFYVGLDEQVAEKRRTLWWKLYYYEKVIASKRGIPSRINENVMNCLLPKNFRDAGFLDNREFIEKVTFVPRNAVFEKMSIKTIANYGELAILQIVSKFSNDVLFNERYTSIRNSSIPALAKVKLFKEVIEKFNEVILKFEAIKEQTSNLFEIATMSSDELRNFMTREEINTARTYSLIYEDSLAKLLSTIDNLEARLSCRPYTKFQMAYVKRNYEMILSCWKRINRIVLNFEDSYFCVKTLFFYGTISVFMVMKIEDYAVAMEQEDVFSLMKVWNKLSSFHIIAKNEDYPQVSDSSLFKNFSRGLSFVSLSCRLTILKYCKSNSIEISDFVKAFQQSEPTLYAIPKMILDTKSLAYRYLLKPVEKSGFHLKFHKMLEASFGQKNSLSTSNNIQHNCGMGFSRETSKPNTPAYNALKGERFSDTNEQSPSANPGMKFSNETGYTETQSSYFIPNFQHVGLEQPRLDSFLDPDAFFSSYNLGTLDEFVNSDMTDLCNILWSDLYPDVF
ncbi:hypothetical protein KAFR_0F03410 [Kazachstania africana CBS 2517]|uniref:Zn(2)-C6 fungal-type domain-containing protein n=1 Tax=Kazachstania africana (strain ATCC 22294 / BCRC 22015 / CBS 2517 / CECT 1963 / NBRC 1671 / NRRL Y-8276) TaxID=1071382 RepID=H2AX37_KAZAF|nr:hypothetical protein KAFR_0F03410 [Kazachstania africana CBS 2517]CCF58937.1 hypothetical protein KAFR_0F03410 [Kazachstania africana CBS 2517]